MRNPLRPRSDDSGMGRLRRLDDRSTERLMSGRRVEGEPGLSSFVVELRDLGRSPAPAPSDALAAMLASGVAREDRITVAPGEQPVLLEASTWARRPFRQVRPSWALAGLTAGVVAVLGTGQAGALPAPAQDVLATAVSWISPLDLPRSEDDRDEPLPEVPPMPSAVPTSPSPRVTPAAVPPPSPEPAPEPADEQTPEWDEEMSEEPVVEDPEAPTEEPGDEPTEEPGDEPAEEPVEEPAEEPTEEPADEQPLGFGIVPKL